METRRMIEDRVERYRSLLRTTLDRSSQEVLLKRIEIDAAKIHQLKRAEAERDRNRWLR